MSSRPFDAQTQARTFLESAMSRGRMPHALLFRGPARAPLLDAALTFAAALFCEKPKGVQSCGACAGCTQALKRFHPDLYILEREEDAREIKIGAVRQLIARAQLRAMRAKTKVFVIAEAHLLNEESQNALLKTLEEPAGDTVIILLSSAPETLLPTIRSRVQSVHFTAGPGAGNDESRFESWRQECAQLALEASQGQPLLLNAPDFSKEDRMELAALMESLAGFFRDALMMKTGAEGLVDTPEGLPLKKRIADRFTEEEIIDRIEIFGKTRERLLQSLNQKLVLAALWDELSSAGATKGSL